MAKDRYEISLWEDYFVDAQTVNDVTIPSHYADRKIVVIGSDTMTSECRAIEPQLVENINGTSTFTFKMYYFYYSAEGRKYLNPFLNLLVNERKVKVFWKDKWYDFLIKNCQENTEDKSIVYTCTDLFINELSKNGFNIELDEKLGNNQGGVGDLARLVLKNTDWSVSDESDFIKQEKEEPVYYVTTTCSCDATKDSDGSSFTLPRDSNILVYYNQIQSLVSSLADSVDANGTATIQFAYADDYITEVNSQLVINSDSYTTTLYWTRPPITSGSTPTINFYVTPTSQRVFLIEYNNGVSNEYRAKRLVQSQKSAYDPILERYCNVYRAYANDPSGDYSTGDEIYGFKSTEFKDPTVVNNIIVNSKNFKDLSGWGGSDLFFTLYPSFNGQNIEDYSPVSLLKLNGTVTNDIKQSSTYFPNGFKKGEKYIFRCKCRSDSGGKPTDFGVVYNTLNGLSPSVKSGNTNYFTFEAAPNPEIGWSTYIGTCIKSISRSDIYNSQLKLQLTTTQVLWLEEAQFFQLVYDEDGNIIYPGVMDASSVIQTYYYYYNHTKYANASSEDDIEYLHGTTSDLNDVNIRPVNNEYEKVRSISVKQSNCFNILQMLAETFECWVQFNIEHEEDGRTKIVNGVPQKTVVIKKELGQEQGIGFVYGIDLKSIQRTIQSDQIVTKTIVSQNSNAYAKDGFCTIARSVENYPRVDFILNFDYYVSQGLLDGNKLNQDLYSPAEGIGYYSFLNKYNTNYDLYSKKLANVETSLNKQEASLTIYRNELTSISTQISKVQNELAQLAGTTSFRAASSYIKAHKDQAAVSTRMAKITSLENEATSCRKIISDLNRAVIHSKGAISSYKNTLSGLKASIERLDAQFYKKYSRFIQEGTWNDESYVDDNLYYLDALSVAYTASRPQVSYTISVIRLSSLEEYKNKVFRLGDISFIQDTDFFGYVFINGIKTPYKEKVLVSQITSYFDEPERDTFTIQNYKTQFEDLFQRITSATQSLQYASGSYARAASIVDSNGTINGKVLQATFDYNKQLVYGAQNDTILLDPTGVTVIDTSNPNRKTKLTSGGVIITSDGGDTWRTVISSDGIGTQYLTTGAINTGSVNIVSGNSSLFRWDDIGLTAFDKRVASGTFKDEVTYYIKDDEDNYVAQTTYFRGLTYYLKNSDDTYTEVASIPITDLEDYEFDVDESRFVRFDNLGIYGAIRSDDPNEDYYFEDPAEVKEKARFGLLWDGLFIKNVYDDHYVEISSTDDIQVVKKINDQYEIAKVKIGKLGDDNYGLQLKDDSGAVTLETDADDGTLLLHRLYISKLKEDDDSAGFFDVDDDDSQGKYEVQLGLLDSGRFVGTKEFYTLDSDGDFVRAYRYDPNTTYYSKNDDVYSEVIEISSTDVVKEVFNSADNFIVYQDGVVHAESGVFRGTIYAESGEFSGTIHALGGSIDQYLSLGTAKLWNPAQDIGNGKILEAQGTILRENGVLQLSGDSVIEGDNFRISPYLSEFSNVNIAGKISAAVFEANKVQAVGGAMLFRPSYKIDRLEVNNNSTVTVYLEDDFFGEVGNYIYLLSRVELTSLNTPTLAQISQKSQDNKVLIVTLLDILYDSNENYISLIDLGTSGSIYIGVNSGPDPIAHLYGEGFTISDFNCADGVDFYNLHTYFGNLGKLGIDGLSGYGLYGDNVYLKGSVTTVSSDGKYSGINTLDGIPATIDNSPIVFWAGAESGASGAVQNAPFQVTQNGSLYARNGYFSGVIQSSEIKVGGQSGSQGGSIEIFDAQGNTIGVINHEGFKLSINGDVKDVSTAFQVLNDSINMNFVKKSGMERYIRFDENGIEIGDNTIDSTNNPLQLKIGFNEQNKQEIGFLKTGEKIAYWDGHILSTGNVRVNQFWIGNFVAIPRTNGTISWLRGVSSQ